MMNPWPSFQLSRLHLRVTHSNSSFCLLAQNPKPNNSNCFPHPEFRQQNAFLLPWTPSQSRSSSTWSSTLGPERRGTRADKKNRSWTCWTTKTTALKLLRSPICLLPSILRTPTASGRTGRLSRCQTTPLATERAQSLPKRATLEGFRKIE